MASIAQLAEGLTIFAKYAKGGKNFNGIYADNGELFFYVAQEVLEPNSDDGKRLQKLGFEPHDGAKPNNGKNWSIYAM